MADPSQLSSAFLAGRQLDQAEVDVDEDLIPYLRAVGDGTYEMCVISPVSLYNAMTA